MHAAPISPLIIQRGRENHPDTYAAMRACTDARTDMTTDQLWIVEHPPVFTLGLGADPSHVLNAHGIPVVQTDRGGEVTYHGPGQAVIYLLFDLRRNKTNTRMYAREFVHHIEQAENKTQTAKKQKDERKPGAPGIYVAHDAAQV